MSSNHTLGPWKVRNKFDIVQDLGRYGAYYIASTRGHSVLPESVQAQDVANARLIASAPRMFDALQKTLKYLQLRADGESNELWAEVAAVMSEATGENVE